QSSPFGRAFASMMQSERLRAFGAAGLAEAYARQSVELIEQTANLPSTVTARGSLASALVLRGDLDGAEAALADVGSDEQLGELFGAGSVWGARAELRLAQGRPRDAVADLRRLEALCERCGWRRYPRGTHVADLARALALAGEREEARALAEAELADARRRGVRRLEAAALVALGLACEGDEGIEALEEAVAVADAAAGGAAAACHDAAAGGQDAAGDAGRAPSNGLRATATLELGAALRRANQRVDARVRLAEARDLAHRAEAAGLLARATEELTIAGGRPRRIALSGADALTPSERRVAEQAARGLTNREIAETLFVTRKTVESQLGAAYSKLGIRSRAQLADALAGE
ncbi:MAG TPA: helix-turn-helix transcriptional regulator, partial [Conexibacter sp.]|nr:helix-turn-helix transcriptional regulator [Conexibacter sp.]